MRRSLVLIILLAGFFNIPSAWVRGQAKADSLQAALKLENRPPEKIAILLALSDEVSRTDIGKGVAFAREALRLAQAENDRKNIFSSTLSLASLHYRSGELSQAAILAQQTDHTQ